MPLRFLTILSALTVHLGMAWESSAANYTGLASCPCIDVNLTGAYAVFQSYTYGSIGDGVFQYDSSCKLDLQK